jgi:glycosyltransferase involved in cell wall biosynthesis
LKRIDKSPKVAINCFGLRPGCGGVASYFRDIVNAFLDGAMEWEPTLFHSGENIPELNRLLPAGWEKHAVLTASHASFSSCGHQYAAYLAPLGPYYPYPVSVPTVVMLADNQEVFFPQFFNDRQLKDRRRMLQGAGLYSDSVVTISKYSAECLHRGYGIPRNKLHVCYPYLKEAVPSQEPSVKPPDRFLFYPANRWEHKNHRVLLESIAQLRREGKAEIALVCTGADMKDGFDLKSVASRQGIADLVHDLGFVSDGEVTFLYQNAEALVFPSLYEGFGYPVLEAMRLDCPVITSTAGSLPEVAGGASEYFDPTSSRDLSEKVLRVWGNERTRSELVEKGRKQAAAFSRNQFVEGHKKALADAIDNYGDAKYFVRKHVSKRLREAVIRAREAIGGPRYQKALPLPDILT